MTKNTGQSAQSDFERIIRSFGKRAYLHRLVDASDVHGLTGQATNISAQPSDFILVMDGRTEFAEVKSTVNETSFPFSLLRATQSAAARQVLAAGGMYFAYVKSLHHDRWFRVPYTLVQMMKDVGTGSLKWAKLEDFAWPVS